VDDVELDPVELDEPDFPEDAEPDPMSGHLWVAAGVELELGLELKTALPAVP
jgi:hypothetical protein